MNAAQLPAASLRGADFSAAPSAAIHRLISREEVISRINVFPVPDGDTGTNLALTLQAVLMALRGLNSVADFLAITPILAEHARQLREAMTAGLAQAEVLPVLPLGTALGVHGGHGSVVVAVQELEG